MPLQKILIALLLTFGFLTEMKAQSFAVEQTVVDYGSIKEWKNDTTWFFLTNTSGKNWFVLPTFYHQEFQIIAPRGEIKPGQTIHVGLSYYTEEVGRFSLEAPLYLSSESKPILLRVKGKIQSFHPDALIYCPNLDPKDPREVEDFLVQESVELKTEEAEEEGEEVHVEEKEDPEELPEVIVEEEEIIIVEEEKVVDTVPLVQTPEELVLKDTVEVIEVEQRKDSIPELLVDVRPEEKKKKELGEAYAINNIVFLIDISGSMKKDNKLENLKKSMKDLVRVLRPEDKISIITYASRAKVVFKTTIFASKDSLYAVIDSLVADGSSYGKDGLNMAYRLAEEEFVESGNNTVILATDGKFNYNGFSENRLYKQAASKAFSKIKLSVIGFGNDMKALRFLKKLAKFGNGDYVYIDTSGKNNQALVEVIKEQSRIEGK